MGRPLIVRGQPAQRSTYSQYRDEVRHDFLCVCAYCDLAEHEATGITFEIDHYWPQKPFTHLVNDFQNLVWSCDSCNGVKDNFHPLDDCSTRVLRPDWEDPRDHYHEDAQHKLVEDTPEGRCTILITNLNREPVRYVREIRARIEAARKQGAEALQKLAEARFDGISTQWRMKFMSLWNELRDADEARAALARDELRALAASKNLDRDPAAAAAYRAERRRYLVEIGLYSPVLRRPPRTRHTKKRKRR